MWDDIPAITDRYMYNLQLIWRSWLISLVYDYFKMSKTLYTNPEYTLCSQKICIIKLINIHKFNQSYLCKFPVPLVIQYMVKPFIFFKKKNDNLKENCIQFMHITQWTVSTRKFANIKIKFERETIARSNLLLLLLLMIWQSPGLPGWRKVNFITVTRILGLTTRI